MNEKQKRAKYTLEFKEEAVRQVKAGRAASMVASTLGMPKASPDQLGAGRSQRSAWCVGPRQASSAGGHA